VAWLPLKLHQKKIKPMKTVAKTKIAGRIQGLQEILKLPDD